MNSKKHAVKLLSVISFLFVFIFLANPVSAQGKKRGKVTTKYPNGMKASQGKVKNYKKQGEWKYWNDEGALTKVEHYKDDVKEGLSTSYYASGKKSEEGNYLGGRKDGAWYSWYTDGSYSSKLNYDAKNVVDEMHSSYEGLQQWYYENGQLREESNYANHELVSRRTFYYGGKKKSIEYFRNGKQDGTWKRYAEDSKDTLPVSIDNFSEGKKEGLHLAYYNGRLSEEWNYKNDKYDGTVKTWDRNGNLAVSENYTDGKRDGLCRYFNYGKCIREASYKLGKPDGEEKEFDSRERLFRQTWYKTGRIDSSASFHPNGKRATERIYSYYPGFVRTEEFSDYTEWDTSGVLLLHGTYHFEQKDKEWTTYYPNGKVKSITPYSNGQMSGVYKKWYVNGKEMIEIKVDGHYATDPAKVWYENGKPVKPNTKYYEEIVDSNKPGEIYNDPKQLQHDRIHFAEPLINGQDGEETIDKQPETMIDKQVEEPVFTYVEQQPEFPGGIQAQQKFISDNIKYPQIEKEAGKQGTVFVSFTVEKDGSITDIKEVKGIAGAPGFTKEAIRLMSMMPNWKPGMMNGRPVRVTMTVPVRFILN
jgi:TonB family protein